MLPRCGVTYVNYTKTMTKPRYDKALFKALGQAVVNRRQQLKQSHEQLGQKSGLTVNQIMEIEGGLRNVNLGTLSKVCIGLGCPLSVLFCEAEALINDFADV